MKLGKKGDDSESLRKQLEEQKKKESEMQKKLEIQLEKERKQKELDEQVAKEKELLENQKKLQENLDKEAKIANDLKQKQEEYARKKAKEEKKIEEKLIKQEKLKDHPDGCFCPECKNLRNETGNYDEIEKPKFTLKPSKFKIPFKKPKEPLSNKEGKEIFNQYDESKNNPNKLMSFINNQKQKIQDKNKPEPKDPNGAIDTKVHPSIFTDITVLGLRLAVGISFIVHGLSKMDGGGGGGAQTFAGMLQSWGMPIELALPIAYAELLAGLFLSLGFLSRIASILIGIIMLGAIFLVKGASALIGQGGVELDVIILACVALIGVFGPGRLSVANISIKGRIFTRFLQ